jgi:hypothetical protein
MAVAELASVIPITTASSIITSVIPRIPILKGRMQETSGTPLKLSR